MFVFSFLLQIIGNCKVHKILINDNIFGLREVAGVLTSKGLIKTDCVVNCAGFVLIYHLQRFTIIYNNIKGKDLIFLCI